MPNTTVLPPSHRLGCKTCGNIPCMRNTDVIFQDLPEPARRYIAELEARVAKLEAELAECKAAIKKRDAYIEKLEAKCERLQFQNAKLIVEKYGTTSEKIVPLDGLPLEIVGEPGDVTDTAEICIVDDDSSEAVELIEPLELTDEEFKAAMDLAGQRKPNPGTHKRAPRKKIPAHFPRVIDRVEIEKVDRQCPCGAMMVKISEVSSEKVRYIPPRLEVVKYIRPKYACRTCYQHVMHLPLPKMPLRNSFAHPSLLAHTIVSKYCDHLPLFRQEAIWQRQGITDIMHRRTLLDWTHKCAKVLEPIVDCMKEKIVQSGYARADETTVRVTHQDNRRKTSKGYMWLFMTGDKADPYVLMEYHPTRGGEAANDFFKDFKGTLLVDGFSGYNALRLRNDVNVAGCNVHMRRKFAEIVKATRRHGKALEALHYIQQLYKIEDNV